jgi:hypothetical protein
MKTPGDFYEWIGEKRKAIRRLHIVFVSVFIFEVVLVGYFLVFALQKPETMASVIGPLGSLLLTTALVYSALRQGPALRFMGFAIHPEDWNLLEDEHKGILIVRASLEFKERLQLPDLHPKKTRRFPYIVQEVKCKSAPSKLRMANDITNIGTNATWVHEYTVQEGSGRPVRYVVRNEVDPQKRIPLDHIFPIDGGLSEGFYELKITAIAATQQLSQSCWVWVSQDRKTIRWCSRKRPLKRYEKLKIKET